MVIVTSRSVGATREALESTEHPVVGWLDLTSPHLVDLIDELQLGPGGHHLVAIIADLAPGFRSDMPTARGLATLDRSGLALWLDSADPTVISELESEYPGLQLEGPYDSR